MNQQTIAIASASANAVPRESSPASQKAKRGPRGGIYDPFPLKFHRMLDQIRDEGSESVVSWLSHGRAFKIHKPKVFAATIMPRFFNQSKYTSFQRQLNLYGFSRCCRGLDSGAYHHPFFLRGKQTLAKNIVRTKIKGNGHKTMKLHEAEPDFHAMAPLPEHSQESDGSSVSSAPGLEQPTIAASQARFNPPDSRSPTQSFYPDVITTNRTHNISPSYSSSASMAELGRQVFTSGVSSRYSSFAPMAEIGRQVSLCEEQERSNDFVNHLNQSIFIHELAMGCSILCQLKATATTHL